MYRTRTPMVLAAVVWLLPAGALQASITLPDPSMVVDGVPLSSQDFGFGDDFVTYSTRILKEMQSRFPSLLPIATYGDFGDEMKGAGVGGQDVIVYTQAKGQKNPPTLDDPLDAATGSATSFADLWGESNPVTVGEILSFLPAGSTTPVFAFDHNQTGADPDLFIRGYVQVLDGDDDTVLDTWYFDAVNNGASDPTPVLSPGEITVTPLTSTPSPFTVDNNKGSGAVDFWGYAPSMDLSVFDSHDKFLVFMELTDLNNGAEELFIAGGISVGVIPEMPSGVVWLGLLAVVASGVKWKGRF